MTDLYRTETFFRPPEVGRRHRIPGSHRQGPVEVLVESSVTGIVLPDLRTSQVFSDPVDDEDVIVVVDR